MDDAASVAETARILRESFRSGKTKSREWRVDQLNAFMRMLKEGRAELCDAMYTDLHKHRAEGYFTEVNMLEHECQHMLDHMDEYMKPDSVSTDILNIPGWSYVYKDPLGVALVIGAWNYPVQLSLMPVIGAIAAGCPACLKVPSDKYSTACSPVLGKLVAKYLDQSCIRVVEGDRHATQAVLQERWDIIFFTGGCFVGKMVAQSAANHLTPTVLELGGKSPCIVDETADLDIAAKRLCWGAFMNAGQTCVRPDYLMVHESVAAKLIEHMKAAVISMYTDKPAECDCFGRLINERAHERVAKLVEDSRSFVVHGGDTDGGAKETKFVAPTFLDFGTDFEAFSKSSAMADEIFGPILPIWRYNDLDKAIDFINGQEKPLAMYVFTTDAVNREKCITSTSSGACDINDCIMHMTNCELPFGGVGMAGMGSYHGKRTFDAFTHHKAVLMKTNYLDVPQRYPPYSTFSVRLLEMLQAARPHWQTNLVVRAAQLLVLWWSYRFLRWTGVLKGALQFLLTMA